MKNLKKALLKNKLALLLIWIIGFLVGVNSVVTPWHFGPARLFELMAAIYLMGVAMWYA